MKKLDLRSPGFDLKAALKEITGNPALWKSSIGVGCVKACLRITLHSLSQARDFPEIVCFWLAEQDLPVLKEAMLQLGLKAELEKLITALPNSGQGRRVWLNEIGARYALILEQKRLI